MARTQLNRGKRLKDAVKLRRPLGGGNGSALAAVPLQRSLLQSAPQVPPADNFPPAMDAAASRILEHLAGSGNGNDKLMLPAQEERRLERALALLGPEQTGEYSAALKKAINTLEEVTQNVLDTTNLMVKGLKELISNNAPAWTESGPKSRSEATRNLCLSLQILQGYGRGLMGAPDRTEEHTHHLRVDNLEGDKTPREALCEIEQILTGRTINFLPPANDGGSDTPQGASQE